MKIATEDFARLAASAAKVANDKHANPVAKFVRLEASGGKLRAMATDFDYWLERSAPCDGDLPVVLVAARQLDEVAKALKADTLDVTADATHLHIKAGKSKRKLAIQPADAFPTLPEVDGEGVSVERATLMAALEFCQPYVDAGRGRCAGRRGVRRAPSTRTAPGALRPVRPDAATPAAPSSRCRPGCAGNTGRSIGTA